MAKTKYTPFLKLKANEVGAIASLSEGVRNSVVPFFDLPMKKGTTPAAFCIMVDKSARKIELNLGKIRPFFLDNFDIPDAITVAGRANYAYVVDAYSDLNFIPVVGLNRLAAHNRVVFDGKNEGTIKSERVAIRLVEDEFDDFDLVEDELSDLMAEVFDAFEECVLILDCRLCLNLDPTSNSLRIHKFITKAQSTFAFAEIIVTGSSVPASIGEVAKTEEEAELNRVELQIFAGMLALGGMEHIGLGDYTIVSPYYSDVTLPPEILPNITAPKVLYTHKHMHYIVRGGALKTHLRGNLQYNDICAYLMKMPFYRGKNYSAGDSFIAQKAAMIGKKVIPSSVLNPTINAHITYMATDHPLVS